MLVYLDINSEQNYRNGVGLEHVKELTGIELRDLEKTAYQVGAATREVVPTGGQLRGLA